MKKKRRKRKKTDREKVRSEQGMEMKKTEWRKKKLVNIDAFHPGHGNSKCCMVGKWACFSFLKTGEN